MDLFQKFVEQNLVSLAEDVRMETTYDKQNIKEQERLYTPSTKILLSGLRMQIMGGMGRGWL